VKDLGDSKELYKSLGFAEFHGDASQGWLILNNGECVIGLFQGMFEKNMLTFSPGRDSSARVPSPTSRMRARSSSG